MELLFSRRNLLADLLPASQFDRPSVCLSLFVCATVSLDEQSE